MSTYYLGFDFAIPRDAVKDEEKLRTALTVVNQASVKAASATGRGVVTSTSVLVEHDDWLFVPRGFDVRPHLRADAHGKPTEEIQAFFRNGAGAVQVPATFTKTLRAEKRQPEAVDAIIRAYEARRDCMVCMSPGRGKTVVAINAAIRTQRRTLVVVDRDFLVDQWIERIETFSDVKREEIGIIRGEKESVGDVFTVAMLKTLSLRELPTEWADQFGMVIFDECHILGAPMFQPVVSQFHGMRVGLSATPDRNDGLDPVFRWNLGGPEPAFVDVSNNEPATWYFKKLPVLLSEQAAEKNNCYVVATDYIGGRRVPRRKRDGSLMKTLQRPHWESLVAANEVWDNIILKDLAAALDSGRHIIVLGTRVEQMQRVHEKLGALGYDCGLVTGKVKKGRDEQFSKQLVFATASLASRALDLPKLDMLMLLFPTTDEVFLRQAKGRTDRSEKRSIVLTYDHNYNPTLDRKRQEMMQLIYKVDSAPRIKRV